MTGPIRLMGIGAAALEWSADALCAQTDPEVFFPEVSEDPAAAVAVCRKCPVRQECLDYAIAAREQHGVWGGHTPNELRRLRAELGSIGLAADAMGITRRAAQSALERHHRPGGAA